MRDAAARELERRWLEGGDRGALLDLLRGEIRGMVERRELRGEPRTFEAMLPIFSAERARELSWLEGAIREIRDVLLERGVAKEASLDLGRLADECRLCPHPLLVHQSGEDLRPCQVARCPCHDFVPIG